jgi:hypothetical protein
VRGGAAAPACRRSASAVYDRRHDRLVMVFGRDAQGFYADAWAFSLRDLRWRALAPGRAIHGTSGGHSRRAGIGRRRGAAAAAGRPRGDRAASR